MFPFMRKVAESRNTYTLVINGDIVDEKDHHPATLVHRLVEELWALSQLGYRIVILKGNHDYAEPTMPFFGFLDKIGNVEFISNPCVLNIAGMQCLMLPHQRDWHQRTQWRRDFPFAPNSDERYDYILAHQTFNGAKASNGEEMKGAPMSAVGIRYTNGARVLAGDIHVPQDIGNVTYVGSPHPVCFGDDFEPRVLVVDKDAYETVPHKTSIARHMLKLRGRDIEGDWTEQLYEEDQCKVQLTLTRAESLDAPEMRERIVQRIEEMGAHHFGTDVKIVADKSDRRRRFEDLNKSKDGQATPEQVFDEYCKHRGMDREMIEAGRKYL